MFLKLKNLSKLTVPFQIVFRSRNAEEICQKDAYRKKYEQLKRRAMDGEFAHGTDNSAFSPIVENPLISNARREIEDQKKMLESKI